VLETPPRCSSPYGSPHQPMAAASRRRFQPGLRRGIHGDRGCMPFAVERWTKVPLRPQQIHARRLWLRAQRLDEHAPVLATARATRAAVEHLGYVQIDTINVIERCHHQDPLHAHPRIPARPSAPGADGRQDGVRNTGRMRCLRADSGPAVLPRRHEVYRQHRSPWVRKVKERTCGGCWPSSESKAPSRSGYRRRRAGGKRPRVGEPQAVKASAFSWLSTRARDISEDRHAETYELTSRHFGWQRPRRPHRKERSSLSASTARSDRRAS